MNAIKLARKERIEVLSSLMFITERKDGRVKSCKYAIGSKQQNSDGYDKAAWSSPTVLTYGLIITTDVDAHEGRDVARMDIPGAFLHTINDEHIIMLLKGKVVELLVQLQPEL